LQELVGTDGLAIDADEEVLRLAVRHALSEELSYRSVRCNVDVIGKTTAIIIDK
jgi:hypothetical protein